MKTTIKQLVALAIFSFIFLAGNVNAEGNKAIASSLETTTETSLQLENWMINDAIWNTNTAMFVTEESEADLEMENWMTDESTWEVAPKLVLETEDNLELENWMVDENNWKI
jgi:hypothetical protein